MHRNRTLLLAIACLLAGCIPIPIRGVASPEIRGHLVDEAGKPITSATLTVVVNKEVLDRTSSDSNGDFRFDLKKRWEVLFLIPGDRYIAGEVVANHPHFRPASAKFSVCCGRVREPVDVGIVTLQTESPDRDKKAPTK